MAGTRPLKSSFESRLSLDHSMTLCAVTADAAQRTAARHHEAILIGIGYHAHAVDTRHLCRGPRRAAGRLFRVFPTKTPEGERTLLEKTIPALGQLKPDFCSVTYGAGGSTREKTLAIVDRIQREQGLTAMAHMTCVNATRDDTANVLAQAQSLGITNILALRGDPPGGVGDFQKTEGGFEYSYELVRFVKDMGGFSIGVAGFPEGHIACTEGKLCRLAAPEAQDRSGRRLRHHAAVFQQSRLFRVQGLPDVARRASAARARRYSHHQRGADQTVRCALRRGPSSHRSWLSSTGAATMTKRSLNIGIDYATRQCEELLREGVPGLHFYTSEQSALDDVDCQEPQPAGDGMNKQKLFITSCLSIGTAAMVFAIRGDVAPSLTAAFQITNEQMGTIFSPAFWAFTIAIFISGNLVDVVGMRTLHMLSALGFILGVSLIILAPRPDAPVASLFDHPGTMLLYAGFFLFGLSHGLVEGVINPLMATIYADEKTKRIIAVHAWWPGGLIIGGLLALGLSAALQRLVAGAALVDPDSGCDIPVARLLALVSADRARHVECVDRRDVETGNTTALRRAVHLHVDDGRRRNGPGPVVSDRHGRAGSAAQSVGRQRCAVSRLYRGPDVRPSRLGERFEPPVSHWHSPHQLSAVRDRTLLARRAG